MKFSIVIPNWNGKNLLEKNLASVLATDADEIIIVDNGSTDGSQDYVKSQKPCLPAGRSKIKNEGSRLLLIENRENLGFARGVNQGVQAASGDIVILLNNDVVPEKDFIKPLLSDFKDEKVFAVSLGEPQWSWALAKWNRGIVDHEPGPRTDKSHASFWASGGSGAFRRNIFLELGGMDEMYKPFYWEDVDLSYRAWKRGYRIIWDPKAVVYHKHEGTIGPRFSKKYIRAISERNRLLFIWKNITDKTMFAEHRRWLLKKLITAPGYWRPFLMAILKLLEVMPKRAAEIKAQKINDKKIFELFQH